LNKTVCEMKQLFHELTIFLIPDEFIAKARYIGNDTVNQYNCYHYNAVGMFGKNINMDFWFTDDGRNLPCQISVFDDGRLFTWAFDGITPDFPPDAIGKCLEPKTQCVDENYICQVRDGADTIAVRNALEWVCYPDRIDCSPINPGGDHFLPDDLISHANWAFDQYYQKYKVSQGSAACDFGGTAHLVPKFPVNQKKKLYQ